MVKTTFRTIEGAYDILPSSDATAPMAQSGAWRYVESVIRDVMGRYAYEEIRTPVLEPTELIARGVGQLTDIVSKEMFSFERGSTRYVLRPEMTAPVMRAYLQHHLDQRPGETRLFYICPCFRAERPQKGRFRQFHQFGAEIMGVSDARADAEVLALMMSVYRAFGLQGVSLKINTLGDAQSRPRYREALAAYLEPFAAELSPRSQERLKSNPLRILDTKVERERQLLGAAPRLIEFVDGPSRRHYEDLKALLDDLGEAFVEDPFLVRGLDYYTRTTFELESPDIGAQSALSGGGRYDLLAAMIGSPAPVPAVGFAAGLERLFLALEAQRIPFPAPAPPDVCLVAVGSEGQRRTFVLAHRLREDGLSVTMDLRGRSMKAQMRMAHRRSARYCVIVADREVDLGQAQIKDMHTGVQTTVSFDAIAAFLLGKRP